MKRQIKTLLVVAASLATVVGTITPSVACDRGGFGGFGGFPRPPALNRIASVGSPYAARHNVYNQPRTVYRQPTTVYSQPQTLYRQPQVIQSQPQRVFSQSQSQPQQIIQTNPNSQQLQANVPASRRGTSLAPARTPNASSPSAIRQPASQSTSATSPSANLAVNTANQPRAAITNTAETSALQMLASVTSKSTPSTSSSSPVRQTSATTASIPQFQPAPNKQVHVGNWKVTLPNSQTVELRLQSDGKFIWTAVSKGNKKTFGGQYRLDGDRLTLVRSGDLQQMAGSWTGSNNQFSFKLDGSNNGGLSFERS